MKLTSKGQVTIPQEIREEAGLMPGDDLDFALENGKITVSRNAQAMTRGRRIVEHLWGRATVRMTTDEIMALTRGED